MTIWELERLRERQNADEVAWMQQPVRLPRVNLWEHPPRKRAEALYILQQIAHTEGAQGR